MKKKVTTADPSLLRQNAQSAAAAANCSAKEHNRLQGIAQGLSEELTESQEAESLSLILVFNLLWLIFASLEIEVSWRLYGTILPNELLVLGWKIPRAMLAAFTVVGLGVIVSHQLRYFVPGLANYEREKALSRHTDVPKFDALQQISRYQYRIKVMGVVVSIVLCALIGKLSEERHSLEAANAALRGQPAPDFGFLDLLPVIAFAAELIAGIFLVYSLQRAWLWVRTRWAEAAAARRLRDCIAHSQSVDACVEHLNKTASDWQPSQEIQVALWRLRHRNSTQPDYTTPVENRSLQLFIRENQHRPLAGAFVMGRTAAGTPIEPAKTGPNGNAWLNWFDDQQQLEVLIVDGREFTGPFVAGTLVTLVLEQQPEPRPIGFVK